MLVLSESEWIVPFFCCAGLHRPEITPPSRTLIPTPPAAGRRIEVLRAIERFLLDETWLDLNLTALDERGKSLGECGCECGSLLPLLQGHDISCFLLKRRRRVTV